MKNVYNIKQKPKQQNKSFVIAFQNNTYHCFLTYLSAGWRHWSGDKHIII